MSLAVISLMTLLIAAAVIAQRLRASRAAGAA
jgi:uncharacterized membrane protein YhaH (DUF805 family)